MYTYIHECRKYYAPTHKRLQSWFVCIHIFTHEKAQLYIQIYETGPPNGPCTSHETRGRKRLGPGELRFRTWDPQARGTLLPISWTYIISIHQGIRRWEWEHGSSMGVVWVPRAWGSMQFPLICCFWQIFSPIFPSLQQLSWWPTKFGWRKRLRWKPKKSPRIPG